MAQKLFIGGLSYNTSNEGLGQFFGQAGEVLSATVVMDQSTGRSRGFGFVEMASSEEAEKAVSQLNGRDLDGRQIKVEVAKPKTDAGRGDWSRSGNRGGWR